MTIDITLIPPERLAMLDTATLFHGSHGGGDGGPDCQHCARELAAEVVTGKHEDRRPAGISLVLDIMPTANDDGRWRDDEHRTAVLRPYLRKILLLDPAKDEARMYLLLDLACRKTMPDICDALKLNTHGSAFRDLAPIVDLKSAKVARALALDLDLALARDLARALALDLARALDLDLDLALALDLDLALARARDLALDLDLALALTLDHARAPATDCERYWRTIFDLMCSI
jgi:hypothetical protein